MNEAKGHRWGLGLARAACLLALAAALAAAFALGGSLAHPARAFAQGETVTVYVSGEYGQTEARSMLAYVNKLRSGAYTDGGQSAPWAYDENGNVDTESYAGLGALTYDYELEKVAMQRAMETVLQSGHTRPDGTSCAEVFPAGYNTVGENLAAGYGEGNDETAYQAFVSLCETDEPYAKQSHRRNMLDSAYNRIGIAHVVVHWEGTLTEGGRSSAYSTDLHYWAQAFGYRTDSNGLEATEACDETDTRAVTILTENVEKSSLAANYSTIYMAAGETANLDAAFTTSMRLTGTWPKQFTLNWSDDTQTTGACLIPVSGACTYSTASSTVASVSGNALSANAVGSTTITAHSALNSGNVARSSLVVGTDASASTPGLGDFSSGTGTDDTAIAADGTAEDGTEEGSDADISATSGEDAGASTSSDSSSQAVATGVDAGSTASTGTTKTTTSAKKKNTFTLSSKKLSVKYAKLKKKTLKFAAKKAFVVKKAKGKVSYQVAKYDKKAKKKITVAKNGKITVKKGLKRGTYKLKVKVRAAGNSAYKPLTRTVTLKVKVA